MIDGGILAKIIEYSSLADSPGLHFLLYGFQHLKLRQAQRSAIPGTGTGCRCLQPPWPAQSPVASGPPRSGGNRFPQPYSPGCSHWPGPSIEPGRPGCVRCLVPLDPLSLPTPTIVMAENAGLAAWDFSVAVCRASKPRARCERGFRSGGGPTVIGSECP